jgi:hypothetical protein
MILNVFGRLNLAEQSNDHLTQWTDDFAYYRPFFFNPWNLENKYRSKGDTIFLSGGTTHEGGYLISILLASDGTMTIAESDYRFNKGDRVEYRTVGGEPLLVFSEARTGAIKDVLKKMDEDMNLYDKYISNYLRYIFAGRYVRVGGSGNVMFLPDKPVVSGFKSSGETPYELAEEYESPVPLLVFGKNEGYKVTKTLTGLELTTMKPTGDENDILWEEDNTKPVIKFVKTADVVSGLPPGRFALASTQVMTLTELKHYAGSPALQNLKFMRNEIFARYGYQFQTKEMADYFAKMEWYKPQFDDVTNKLTEIKRINIALIQVLEKEMAK